MPGARWMQECSTTGSRLPTAWANRDAAQVRQIAADVRAQLETQRDDTVADNLAVAYAGLAVRFFDDRELRDAATFLGARIGRHGFDTARAYSNVVARLASQADVKQAVTLLRRELGSMVVSSDPLSAAMVPL